MAKQIVSFIAKKTVKEPRIVRFDTKQGEVSFKARVNVQKPVRVRFSTKKK